MVAHLIDGLLDRNPALSPEEVDDCIVGCADQTGEQTGNIGRLSVALSRLPLSVPGSTVNRFCSSGLNTIATAATQVASGYADVVMAGGVESITLLPARQLRGDLQESHPPGEQAGHLHGDGAIPPRWSPGVTR